MASDKTDDKIDDKTDDEITTFEIHLKNNFQTRHFYLFSDPPRPSGEPDAKVYTNVFRASPEVAPSENGSA